nr:transcriptional regulator [Fredinandcohnia onubensis]
MFQIGIITAKNSLTWIRELENFFDNQCQFTFLPYENFDEIKEMYEKNALFMDGIIFSGQVPYFYIKKELKYFEKPTIYFDLNESDFYKTLCKTILKEKNFDISRTLIDFIFEQNNFLGLKEWLEEEEFPYFHNEDIESFDTETVYDDVFQQHISLFKAGKIDLSFTRISSISKKLTDNGVKHVIVNPSLESMIKKVNDFINQIKMMRLTENQVAIGNIAISQITISPDMNHDLERKMLLLNQALLDYNTKKQHGFIIQRNFLNFEVITNYKALKDITNEFTQCSLLSYLKQTLPYEIDIGWGIGNSLQEARLNAEHANKERRMDRGTSYIMTEDEQLIGPLGDETCLQIPNQLNTQIEKFSSQIGMSALQIQKIMAVLEKLQTNEIVSDDLAIHFGISQRAANRILQKLEEKGVAEVSYKKQKKLRGRPKKVYHIDFLAKLS